MRVVERMTMTNASFRPCMVRYIRSVQGEAFRWAAGFTRNVTSVDDAGLKTGEAAPCHLAAGRAASPKPTQVSAKDSAEDVCLWVIHNLAWFQPSPTRSRGQEEPGARWVRATRRFLSPDLLACWELEARGTR